MITIIKRYASFFEIILSNGLRTYRKASRRYMQAHYEKAFTCNMLTQLTIV